MLPVPRTFPTLFWETQCLDTYSLPLGDSPVSPRRSTILLIRDFYCFSPYLPAPIFPPRPHPLPVCRARPPRGLATPLRHRQWSQRAPSSLFLVSSPCPITPTCSWVHTSLGVLAHTGKVTDSVPSEASFSHLQPPPHPSPSLGSRELHQKETSI